MDTLTHALSGALLARAVTPAYVAPGSPGVNGRMAAGFVAGAFPDIDFAMRAVDTLWYLNAVHQGATHSLVLLPLWAFVVAWLFGRFSGLGWRPWFLPAALGLAIHIVGDLITAYGTMILYPFSDWRPALSLSYVVDPYFTAIIVAGLVAALYRPDRGRAAGVTALLCLGAYVGLQGGLQQRAVGLGEAYVQARELGEASARVLPQPFSPGHWTVVVSEGDAHHTAWVRVLPGRSLVEVLPATGPVGRMAASYRHEPRWRVHARFGTDPREATLAREAWTRDGFRPFRRFARFPALHEVETTDAGECAWFMDLRFMLPELPPSFVFGKCRDHPDAPWRLERRRGALWLD